MSPAELNIQAITETIIVDSEMPTAEVIVKSEPDILVLALSNMGPQGPPGPPGQWKSMTQEEYDALASPDPQTLYVIVE